MASHIRSTEYQLSQVGREGGGGGGVGAIQSNRSVGEGRDTPN